MNDNVLAWLAGRDTGLSSRSIVAVMERDLTVLAMNGNRIEYPRDPSDLGRCIRLLDIEPSYRNRLGQMSHYGVQWAALGSHWDELEALYRAEEPSGRAPKCGARMIELLYPDVRQVQNAIKYANITIGRDVYIDSLGHYHFMVMSNKLKIDHFSDGFERITHPPEYLELETKRQIAALLKSGEAKFYEHDRDGNRRYTELRYRNPDMEAWYTEQYANPTVSYLSLPLELRLLHILVMKDYWLFGTGEGKYRDIHLIAYLSDDVALVVESIPATKVDKLMSHLKCVRQGTNVQRQKFRLWIADNAPESHRVYEHFKHWDKEGRNDDK